jgi:DNA-binding MltR family transcriptional regulator
MFEELKYDLMEESDRGCVILAASIIDAELRQMLLYECQVNGMSQKATTDLFDSNGPLSTFSGKSSICRAFGLINDDEFRDIGILRKLRNRFAHDMEHADFLKADIKDLIMSMHCCRKAHENYNGEKIERFQRPKMPIPEYEIRSKGFVKYNKAVFCIGVEFLRISIKETTIVRLNKQINGHKAILESLEKSIVVP